MVHPIHSCFRYGFLLVIGLSIYTTLFIVTNPIWRPSHDFEIVNNIPTKSPAIQASYISRPLHTLVSGQCEYNISSPMPRVVTLTGGKKNVLFIYDTTFQFEYGGGGEGMAYFVGFLEAETPKYIEGGNHATGAGLHLVQEWFSDKVTCHWSVTNVLEKDIDGNVMKANNIDERTEAAWLLNGDTSTFSFYCRIPASIGWIDMNLNTINLALESPRFIPDNKGLSLPIPVCIRSQTFHKISVCTQPLHAPLPPTEVRQWIEYHFLLGIDHFYIYDRDGSFATMLKPYECAGLVTRYEFPLLTPGMNHKWYDQPQGMHHCLWRHRHTTRWMFFLDVDEYLHSDTWIEPGPHVAKIMARYQEAPLHHYTHLIVHKRLAIPPKGYEWNHETTTVLEALTRYGKSERVAVKFTLRPWDGRTLGIHNPNSFVVFNSKEQDFDPKELVISHMKRHNTLKDEEVDTTAKPPHSWIVKELRHRIYDKDYVVTPDSVTPYGIDYVKRARQLAHKLADASDGSTCVA